MRKTIKELTFYLVLSLFFSANSYSADLKICAVPQVYSAFEAIKEISPVNFESKYASATDIYAKIANNEEKCDIVISSDEKLPILLIRSGKASAQNKEQLVRAPLLLWSKDPSLLDKTAYAITTKKLKSIAIANPHLTPVGFASHKIFSQKNFPKDYLNGHIFRADHEYQVFAMVENGNVQCGFLSRPLIIKNGLPSGSYWQVPRGTYPDLIYYAQTLDSNKNKRDAQTFIKFLKEDHRALNIFIKAGFSNI